MKATVPVVVIGAGPYGLSLASWLRSRGIPFLLFGDPLELWRRHMDPNALLRSHPELSCPSNPLGAAVLLQWIKRARVDLHARPRPCLTVREFCQFMRTFMRRFGLDIAERRVDTLARASRDTFRLTTGSGGELEARAVVLCTGLSGAARLPAALVGVPGVRHSSQPLSGAELSQARVLVIGGGQSAAEAALAARQHGARRVIMAFRKPSLEFRDIHRATTPERQELMTFLRHGFVERSARYRHRHFDRIMPTSIEPDVRASLERDVELWPGTEVVAVAPAANGGSAVSLRGPQGGVEADVDVIISASGYAPSVTRSPVQLSPGLRAGLGLHGGLPELSELGESRVPGLFFAGAAAALRFGPQSNFVFGTEVTVKRLVDALDGFRCHGSSLRRRPAADIDNRRPLVTTP